MITRKPGVLCGPRSVAVAICVTALLAWLAAPSIVNIPAASASSCGLSSVSSASQPSCWTPFTAGSPFNTLLPADPKLAADSAAVQQHMATYGWALDQSNTSFSLDDSGSRPVFFATPSDPVMRIHCTDISGPNTCQGADGINIDGAQINVPAGARPDSNTDAHMTIIEPATGVEYAMWDPSVSGSTITAGTGAEINVNTSNGLGSAGDAANFALTAGLLRPSELASGQINHALVVTVPCTNATGFHVGYTWPALGGFGQPCDHGFNQSDSDAP